MNESQRRAEHRPCQRILNKWKEVYTLADIPEAQLSWNNSVDADRRPEFALICSGGCISQIISVSPNNASGFALNQM